MAKGNFDHNYPLVIKFLQDKDIEYQEYNDGQQLRILGETALIDLWPSRMTYHIVQSERPAGSEYARLSFYFDANELDKILND